MALTIRLTPQLVLSVGDIVTEDILNSLADSTIEFEGTVSTANIADESITLAKLALGILADSTAGRARMADGFVTAAKLAASLDLSGKTITGNPTITWTGVIDLSGATVTLPTSTIAYYVTPTPVALAANTTLINDISHNLGGLPRIARMVLVADATPELGYAAGDEVDAMTCINTGGVPMFAMRVTSTKVSVFQENYAAGNVLLPSVTTKQHAVIVFARWALKIYLQR